MTVNRDLWAEIFQNDLPHWPCPTCGKGHLVKVEGNFLLKETGPSKAAHDHDAWDPDWIQKRFAGLLECSMPGCKELVSVSGSANFEHYQVGWEEYVENDLLRVESIQPAPIPISCPEETPEQITDAIGRASALVWSSPESAANQIRQAVEALMDDAGILGKTAAGRYVPLHDRIAEFRKTDRENGDVLLATKWLGNSASHVGGIGRGDVLDAFDMIEFVLENRYGTTKKDIMAKVAAVNAAKGPTSRP